MVLTGANSYTGTTTISGGTLQIGAGGTAGMLGSGDILNYTALVINRSDTLTVSNEIFGPGTLTQAGNGTLLLSGANTYTGQTTISGGTLAVANASALGAALNGTILAGGTLLGTTDLTLLENDIRTRASTTSTIAAVNNTTLTLNSAGPSGNASILRFGAVGTAGTVVVNNAFSSNTGKVAIDAGTLQIGSGNAGIFLLSFIESTTIQDAGTLDIAGADTSVTDLSGSGTVTNSGADDRTLELSAPPPSRG